MSSSVNPAGSATAAPTRVEQAPGPLSPERRRLDSLDLLRGIVMVIMLLDHSRAFLHAGVLQYDPTDLSQTSTAVFFTRWITHFCAPVFVFLAGTGAYLQLMRGKGRGELSRFLLTRGLWLVVVEFVIVRGVVTFNFDPSFIGVAQVIWAIGISMVVLAALIHLPLAAVAAIGLGLIALHNLLDPVQIVGPQEPATTAAQMVWLILHQQGLIQFGANGPVLFVLYPLIPWIGVMAVGYAFGALYRHKEGDRRRAIVVLGAAATLAFLALRAANVYGDPSPWGAQESAGFTMLSFLNTTKYPPSLLFLVMTLGPALLALVWFERLDRRGATVRAPLRWLVTFGRVPLFFYVLQWLFAHLAGIGANIVTGRGFGYLLFGPPGFGPAPEGAGFPLWVVYAGWILGTVLLYFPCRWFADLKRRRGREWGWLSYA